jgi:predicted transcriptional regulator
MEQVDAGLDGQLELPIEEDEKTLAAIDQGIQDADAGRLTSLEEVEALIPQWVSEFSSPAGR